MDGDSSLIFTQIGANDPLFNLRNENAFIKRKTNSKNHTFVSVLEPHGEYNPSKEFTLDAVSKLTALTHIKQKEIDVITFTVGKQPYGLAINNAPAINKNASFKVAGKKYPLKGRFALIKLAQ
jgi:hypothetical protein